MSSQIDRTFLEIEHKYLVDETFDVKRFFRLFQSYEIQKTYQIRVEDTYFLNAQEKSPSIILRHRFDAEGQELTLKSYGKSDSIQRDVEKRLELNLHLSSDHGSQLTTVTAFLEYLNMRWHRIIEKEIDVLLLKDCEIVFYIAKVGTRKICCVEFEALNHKSDIEALQTIEKYERIGSFDKLKRCHESIFELFFKGSIS